MGDRQIGSFPLSGGHEGSVSCCVFNKDASVCVSGGYDSRVVLWDTNINTPKLILKGHTDWINDVAISSDNKWIASVGKVFGNYLFLFYKLSV